MYKIILMVAVLVLATPAEPGAVRAAEPMSARAQAAPPATAHTARGIVVKVDAAKGVITLKHCPVASLKWPAMTMDFRFKDGAVTRLNAGDAVQFEFVKASTDYLITRIAAVK